MKFKGEYSVLYVLGFIIFGSLFINLAFAGNPTPPTIPNMPIHTSMTTAKIGSQYLSINWTHLPVNNLSTQQFILKFTTNSSTAPVLSGNNGGNFSLLLMNMTNLSTFNLSNVKVQYLVPYVKSQSYLYECSVFNNPTCTTVGQVITSGNSTSTTCAYIGRTNYTSYTSTPVNYAYLKCNKTYTVNHYDFTNPTFPISLSQFSYLTNSNGTQKTGVFKLNELTNLPASYQSNTKLNYREYKVTIYNVPINRLSTGGIESTGTFAVDVNGKIFYDKTHSSWWDNTFLYKKQINITETSGTTLTNYSTLMYIPYTSGMNADFSDLRFTNSAQDTELGYWIDNYTASTDAYVWVKVPTLLASSVTDIYMYYGNSGAVTTSNENNAFIYFDEGDKITSWTSSGATSQDNTVGNPVPSYNVPSASGDYLYKNIGMNTNQITTFNIRTTGLGNLFFNTNSAGAGQMYRLDSRSSQSSGFTTTSSWTSWTVPQSPNFQGLSNTWYKFGIVTTDSTSATIYYQATTDKNPSLPSTNLGTFTYSNNGQYIGLIGDGLGSSYYTYFDNIITRGYASSIPTYTIGSEQSTPCPLSGTVKDTNGVAITDSRVVAMKVGSDISQGNTTTNSTGGWNINVAQGFNYSVYAYEPNNFTRAGAIAVNIKC